MRDPFRVFRRRFPPFILRLTGSIRGDPVDAAATALFVFRPAEALAGAALAEALAGAALATFVALFAALVALFAAFLAALFPSVGPEAGLEANGFIAENWFVKEGPGDPAGLDALAPISIYPFEFYLSLIERRDPTPEPHATPVPTQDARVLYLVAPFVLRLTHPELLEIHRITDSLIHDDYKYVRG